MPDPGYGGGPGSGADGWGGGGFADPFGGGAGYADPGGYGNAQTGTGNTASSSGYAGGYAAGVSDAMAMGGMAGDIGGYGNSQSAVGGGGYAGSGSEGGGGYNTGGRAGGVGGANVGGGFADPTGGGGMNTGGRAGGVGGANVGGGFADPSGGGGMNTGGFAGPDPGGRAGGVGGQNVGGGFADPTGRTGGGFAGPAISGPDSAFGGFQSRTDFSPTGDVGMADSRALAAAVMGMGPAFSSTAQPSGSSSRAVSDPLGAFGVFAGLQGDPRPDKGMPSGTIGGISTANPTGDLASSLLGQGLGPAAAAQMAREGTSPFAPGIDISQLAGIYNDPEQSDEAMAQVMTQGLRTLAPGKLSDMYAENPMGFIDVMSKEAIGEGVPGLAAAIRSGAVNRAIAEPTSPDLAKQSYGATFEALGKNMPRSGAKPGSVNAAQALLGFMAAMEPTVRGIPPGVQDTTHYYAPPEMARRGQPLGPEWAQEPFRTDPNLPFGGHSFVNTPPGPARDQMADLAAQAFGQFTPASQVAAAAPFSRSADLATVAAPPGMTPAQAAQPNAPAQMDPTLAAMIANVISPQVAEAESLPAVQAQLAAMPGLVTSQPVSPQRPAGPVSPQLAAAQMAQLASPQRAPLASPQRVSPVSPQAVSPQAVVPNQPTAAVPNVPAAPQLSLPPGVAFNTPSMPGLTTPTTARQARAQELAQIAAQAAIMGKPTRAEQNPPGAISQAQPGTASKAAPPGAQFGPRAAPSQPASPAAQPAESLPAQKAEAKRQAAEQVAAVPGLSMKDVEPMIDRIFSSLEDAIGYFESQRVNFERGRERSRTGIGGEGNAELLRIMMGQVK